MADFVVMGEALVDLFAEPGRPLGFGSRFTAKPGGAPANVAMAMAKLGVPVAFLGKVGRDPFGAALRHLLADHGVDVTHMTEDPGLPTMTALVALPAPDRPEFVLYQGANCAIRPEDLPADLIATARGLIFGSVTLATRSDAAGYAAARMARAAGRHFIFDVNLRPSVWADLDQARVAIDRAIALASVVKLNETEMQFLFGDVPDEEGLDALLRRGVELACLSKGEGGATIRTATVLAHVPAFRVQVLETTGCGDAFLAGLASQLLRDGRPVASLSRGEILAALGYANACGAVVATQLGAMEADLSHALVEAMLAADEHGAGFTPSS